jgi:ABC-type lipoprotein export system ATPase subunit
MNRPLMLVVRSVSKSYGRGRLRVSALQQITFEVGQGEFVRLVGPSGSGKTTLLNLIAALDRPDKGEILVAGTDVTQLSHREMSQYRAERVGIVFQTYNLIPQLTAFENVLLPMIAAGRADHARVHELLDVVGLADRSGHRPPQLSGGEQQRVAIARALANDPALVLADEPTGNLDDSTARSIMALLSQSCRERGNTLILVTHDPVTMCAADRTFEIRSGTLADPHAAQRMPSDAGR